MFGVPFPLRASSKPRCVDGECCWMPADKAEWLKTLPLFGGLSPNPNENTEGSRGQRRGEDSHPSVVGTQLGHAEQGHLVGFGVWGFKSFGTKTKEPGHDHRSHTQAGRACRGSCRPALSALNLGFLQSFLLIRGSMRKKKLETKETGETRKENARSCKTE